MRGARFVIWVVVVLLVGVPLATLGIAKAYETWLAGRYEEELRVVAAAVAGRPRGEWEALARRERVELRLVDSQGSTLFDTRTAAAALERSPFGRVGEAVLATVGRGGVREPIDQALETAGSVAGFDVRVSPGGELSVFALRVPHPEGLLHVVKASQRGVRRLLPLTEELVRLTAYQALLAGLVALVLSRRLVWPLEALAKGAAAYPREPLAKGPMLQRRDEVGQLARAMSGLADALEHKRRATAELAADMAHELKNPLATIAAAAELVGGTRELSPERRRLVEDQIGLAVRRLRDTTDALLGLERLEAALPDARRTPVEPAAHADAILQEYREDPRWAGWTFTLDATMATGPVVLVEDAWARLLRNLVDNALVQPATRREVVVSITRDEEWLELRVRDFGPGVSPGNRERIFRRFFTSRPEGAPTGTGLGLSIVQAVAEAHGGRVALDANVSPGASFVVRVPVA